jgi:uncharacterized protein YggT (Ycf19 family)
MMMFTLYKTNIMCWIFIVLAHWNNSPWVDMSLHIILNLSQPVFAPIAQYCVLRGEPVNTNVIVFVLIFQLYHGDQF